MSKDGKIVSMVKSIVEMTKEKRVMTYAAAADYHMVISLAPALMLMLSLVRLLPVTQEEILRVFSDTLPAQWKDILDSITSSIFSSSGTTTVISFLLLLVSASGAMRSLMKGIYEVYGSARRESFLLFAGRAVLYTLLLLVMIVVSLAVLVYGSGFLEYLLGKLPEGSFLEALIAFVQKTRYVLWSLILTLIFMVFYHFLPAEKPKFRNQFPGAIFCAFAWAVFSWGYSIYVSVSDKFGAYGFLGTIMVVMMWMYYCLMFFLLGGCINVFLSRRA